MNVKEKKKSGRQLNAGTGMVGGIVVGALVALIVSALTGDQAVWSWTIPVGLAAGLAIGAGRQQARRHDGANGSTYNRST